MTRKRDVVRLDKWLWAARLYKSRSLAAQAVVGGKAQLGGRRVKPGAGVAVGDVVRVRKGPYEVELVVRGLAERRGPAREAAALYAETESSEAARAALAAALESRSAVEYHGKGRPTKRERRRLDRMLDAWDEER